MSAIVTIDLDIENRAIRSHILGLSLPLRLTKISLSALRAIFVSKIEQRVKFVH